MSYIMLTCETKVRSRHGFGVDARGKIDVRRPEIYKSDAEIAKALDTGADLSVLMSERGTALARYEAIETGRKVPCPEIDLTGLYEARRVHNLMAKRIDSGVEDPVTPDVLAKIEASVDASVEAGVTKLARRDGVIGSRVTALRKKALVAFTREMRNEYAAGARALLAYHASYANAPEKRVGIKAKAAHADAAAALTAALAKMDADAAE